MVEARSGVTVQSHGPESVYAAPGQHGSAPTRDEQTLNRSAQSTQDQTPEIQDKLIKADIVNRVAEVADISRVKAVQAVDTIFSAMKEALRAGKRIELRGFGVFQVRDRKKGVGRNPKTGVEVAITPGKTVRFKPGKDLRDLEPLT